MMTHAVIVDFLFVRFVQGVPPAGAGGIADQFFIDLLLGGGFRQTFAGDPFFLGDGQGRPPHFKIVVSHRFPEN